MDRGLHAKVDEDNVAVGVFRVVEDVPGSVK